MCNGKMNPPPKTNKPTSSTTRWLLGMTLASIFSLVFLLTPLYTITSILALIFSYPNRQLAWIFASPLIVSAFTKPIMNLDLVDKLSPMLDYFDYEEVSELSIEDTKRFLLKEKKNIIIAGQPHGVVSFCGICSAIAVDPELRGIKVAVASVVTLTPIIKHVFGIFGFVDASRDSLKKHIAKKGIEGSVIIYVGGIAELFKSSGKEERLYLKKRKGFVKLALREGVDIAPVYFFGNTSILTVVKTGLLATLSRKLGVSLTYFWGKYFLPIPRDEKLVYARGKPLGMPHIPDPTNEDVDKWHNKYCDEVRYLFEKYKHMAPRYKDKTLYID